MPYQILIYGRCKQAQVSSLQPEESGVGQVYSDEQSEQEEAGSCAPAFSCSSSSCDSEGEHLCMRSWLIALMKDYITVHKPNSLLQNDRTHSFLLYIFLRHIEIGMIWWHMLKDSHAAPN